MKTERVLLIGGIIVTQVLLLIAVFALGIYIGRYGLTEAGLSYGGPGAVGGQTRPGNVQPGGVQPGNVPGQGQQGGVPDLPPGLTEPPQAIARLLNISPDQIDVAMPEGPRPVLVDENTIYEDTEGNTFTLRDLHQGMILAIYGEFDQTGRNFVAARIVIMPVEENQQQPQPPQPAATIPAELDTEFRIRVGQTAQIAPEGLAITFSAVTEDSRCPVDAQCVQAGQAVIVVEVARDGASLGMFNLTLGDPGSEALSVNIPGYRIEVKALAPAPRSGKTIPPSEYVARLIVSRQ